ncbi:hypothetical protein EZ428_09200 [Pedobacter frigiditerrae]|uniref:Uncharacterized protein n=1 Tax=Pedobacter frigiditerrae TaxID=2530452 RepID=A0A4R0N0W1_9SPHI|nr:hypothetical protein [Pedobacter frigiditerrae]TCC91914.1 hypothetical protein EZ428_09200 [Pedobacter frigiditerrae]
MPISSSTVEVSDDCVGNRWEINDENELANLVAFVTKAQAIHAQNILAGIVSDSIVFEAAQEQQIKQSAIDALTVPKDAHGKEIRGTALWHRDGILFEAISWIVARKHFPDAIMRDPHISPTTQGLDGLMIVLSPDMDEVLSTIIFEDKCVEDPTHTFRYETLPALLRFHVDSRKVLESASTILQTVIPLAQRPSMAAKSISSTVRAYRASFPIPPSMDNVPGRAGIFDRYNQIVGIAKERRIGGMFLATEDIRAWFEQFAIKVIGKL